MYGENDSCAVSNGGQLYEYEWDNKAILNPLELAEQLWYSPTQWKLQNIETSN